MTYTQWIAFDSFRNAFKKKVDEWSSANEALLPLQENAARADKNPVYPLETPIVYNHSLDDILPDDEIKLIVVGDNPGKDEQRTYNKRYLVGQAGKLADGFFKRHSELGVDFRKNVIILNKTPIHTAKTKQISHMLAHASSDIIALFDETQRWMAYHTAELQKALACQIWLVGYAELRKKGLFEVYRETLVEALKDCIPSEAQSNVYSAPQALLVFQHFSMNRFSIDLNNYLAERHTQNASITDLATAIQELGIRHRREILGI